MTIEEKVQQQEIMLHELTERLLYDDIQALDEEEFAAAVRKLIFDADPAVQLPF